MRRSYLLHHLLERSADRYPDREAVVDPLHRWTYAELANAAARVANHLRAQGVGAGERVAVLADKCVQTVAGLYGILSVGACYVPLDVRSPSARLAAVLHDCDVAHILVTASRVADVGRIQDAGGKLPPTTVLDAHLGTGQLPPEVTAFGRDALDEHDPSFRAARTIDEDLAYILYTSGSTGVPKGVMLSHRNALAFVQWAVEEMSLTEVDRLSNHAPFHFDLSVFDLYAAAAAGATSVLVPPRAGMLAAEVRRTIEQESISVWYSVPSILVMLAERGGLSVGELPSLRAVLYAGEPFPGGPLTTLMRLLPHASFWNLYGPTETNVCTAHRLAGPPAVGEAVPIGGPIANVDTVVVDEDGVPCAAGQVGELLVRGATVMRGYWNDPQRSAERLVGDPRGRPGPMYRTGDLVRERADGQYDFLGRRDRQVKRSGYRIELGEIDAAVRAHPSVLDCAVVAVPDPMVANRIVAFATVRDETSTKDLRRCCASRVPRWMVPDHIEVCESLPHTTTGKVDHVSLSRVAAEHLRAYDA